MPDHISSLLPLNGIRVCIDSKLSEVSGRAYSLLMETPITFVGWTELLLKMDMVFDKNRYPQAFEEKRRFVSSNEENVEQYKRPFAHSDVNEIEEKWGEIVTLEIRVEKRRKANWQGVVYLVDNDIKEKVFVDRFESDMDLLKILNKIENQSCQ